MDPNQASSEAPKDQNVLSFMMQLVQEKYGDEIEIDFLNQESNRLYDVFGSRLVSYFEPMMNEEQKGAFDSLVDMQAQQEQLLGFLVEAIPNLEEQILQVLVNFRLEYLENRI